MLAKLHQDESVKPRSKSHFNPVTKLENMTVTYFPELLLFCQSINQSAGTFTVEYRPPKGSCQRIEIPLEPGIKGLKCMNISLHQSPAQAYDMGDEIDCWFSKCCGYDVILVYLEFNRRPVLGNLSPNTTSHENQSWFSSVKSAVPAILGADKQESRSQISFADVAAYLVVTEESLKNVSSRLSDGSQMDVTKFRPNIVVSGAPGPWDEDYWGRIIIKTRVNDDNEIQGIELALTQNCARCVSINVDYETGQPGTGEAGTVLKKLMKDRRIDKGNKYSPIFGRYGFLDPRASSESRSIAVGDEVIISTRNAERTTFGKERLWS